MFKETKRCSYFEQFQTDSIILEIYQSHKFSSKEKIWKFVDLYIIRKFCTSKSKKKNTRI